jgi:hypothetical protein
MKKNQVVVSTSSLFKRQIQSSVRAREVTEQERVGSRAYLV